MLLEPDTNMIKLKQLINEIKQIFEFKPRDIVWFEYHCYEGHDSADAQLWYHSHQQVKILKICFNGTGATPEERAENGHPAGYTIQFNNGFKADVFEDELMKDKKDFFRPNPPSPKLK
jgi:hypothetical protein